MPTESDAILAILAQKLNDLQRAYSAPPDVHFQQHRVQPPSWEYVTADDYLAVSVYTASATTGLTLGLRILLPDGRQQYQQEAIDVSATSTLTKFVFKLAEGYLISVTVSNQGSGLADQTCWVELALQKGVAAANPPHTLLQQGFVSDHIMLGWPIALPRGPAPKATTAATVNGPATETLPVVNPTIYYSVDIPPAEAGTFDDEFDGSVLGVAWSWDNQGTGATGATIVIKNSWASIICQSQGTINAHSILQALPVATTWELTAKLAYLEEPQSNDNYGGIILRESGTNKRMFFGIQGPYTVFADWSSVTSGPSTNTYSSQSGFPIFTPYWRVNRTGANLNVSVSLDGISWTQLATIPCTTRFTAAPDQIGLMISDSHSSGRPSILSCDWFRRTL